MTSEKSPPPELEARPNGPYAVKNLPRLVSATGEALPVKPAMALCRCGGSSQKPFCDGTHRKNGFSSARQSDPKDDARRTYPGKGIVVYDNRSLCAHAGRCTDGLANVFRSGGTPWIDCGGASVAEIIATVQKCPSGALSYSIPGEETAAPTAEPGSAVESGSAVEPCIAVEKNGPYHVTGGVALQNEPWRQGASPERYTLCRCGHSKNKPFCDGSHWDAGFEG